MAGRIAKVICFFLFELLRVIGGMKVYPQNCFADKYCFSLILNQGSNGSSLIEAQSSCTSIRSKLAEISSSEIQNYIIEFMKNAFSVLSNASQKNVLINAQLHDNETWFWINGKQRDNFTESLAVAGNQSVAQILENNNNSITLESAPPSASGGYICEYPNETFSSCRPTCTFKHEARCFCVSNDTEKNWFSARKRCLEHNGDLASLDFVDNNTSFDSLNASAWFNSTTKYWIGLRKSWWIWGGSGSEVKYTNWKSDAQYNNSAFNCISLSHNGSTVGQWITVNCNSTTQLHYLCLREKYQHKTTDSSTTTETTLNNATDVNTLALGLGVGLGVCVAVLIIFVVILVVFIIRKRPLTYDVKSLSTSPPSVEETPFYAQVQKHKKEDGETSEDNSTAAAAITTPASQTLYATVRESQTTSSAAHDDSQGKPAVYVNFDIMS